MYYSVFLHIQAVKLEGIIFYSFLHVTEGFSFAVIMQLSHDSVMLVIFVLVSCIISVIQVIIFNHSEQLNNQS